MVGSADTRDLIVKLNVISHCGAGIAFGDDGASGNMSIENNHLSDIGGNATAAFWAAISILRAVSVAVSGNTVNRVGVNADGVAAVAGILVAGVDRLRIAGNSVTDIGPAGSFERGIGAGVMVLAPFLNADIVHNRVDRESTARTQDVGHFFALWVGELSGPHGSGSNLTGFDSLGKVTGQMAANAGAGTLIFGQRQIYMKAAFGLGQAGGLAAVGSSVGVLGNSLGARGLSPAASVIVRGDCLFNDNRCELRGGSADAVRLAGEAVIVSANRVRGGEVSVRIESKSATVLGNITTHGIFLNGSQLTTPWLALNVIS